MLVRVAEAARTRIRSIHTLPGTVRPEQEERLMSKLMGFVFAACLLAIGTSTSISAASP
jgi:hypothetical protein